MEQIPSTRESARRLGLVTIGKKVGALVRAVENPAQGCASRACKKFAEKLSPCPE